MTQPELGRKISELRKAKGLTQEELVEKCNISVRTLQRIETGEVTPRSYTLKTILAALDNDLHTIEVADTSFIQVLQHWFRTYFLLEIDLDQPPDWLTKRLNASWISGIFYLLIGFIGSAAEYFRYKDDVLIYGAPFYVAIKAAELLAFIVFQSGFVLIGGLFKNYLLRITSFLLIAGNSLVIGYDIVSIFYESVERQYVLGSEALVIGSLLILYGISLWRLRKYVGAAATVASVFEIMAGCFFLTLILSFMGFILLVPAELCEIIILYKAMDLMHSYAQKLNHTPIEAA